MISMPSEGNSFEAFLLIHKEIVGHPVDEEMRYYVVMDQVFEDGKWKDVEKDDPRS